MDEQAWPASWKQGELTLALSYRFEPGAADDGVTVEVPLQALGQLRSDRFEWLVPGLREELVTTLIRTLPKELRRPLVPVPETAAEVLARLEPRRRPLVEDMERAHRGAARRTRAARGVGHRAAPAASAGHASGCTTRSAACSAEGKDLAEVRARVRPQLRAELTAAAARLERSGLRSWDIGSLPREVTLRGTGQAVRAYPALVDEGETAGVAVLENAVAQRAAMRAGTRRLLRLTIPLPRAVRARPAGQRRAGALATAPHGSLDAALDDAVTAALDAADRRGGRAGVGRGGLRAPARPRRRAACGRDVGDRRRHGAGARRGPRRRAQARAAHRRPAPARAGRRARAAAAARPPRARGGGPPRRRRALPAGSRPEARAAPGQPGGRPRPHERRARARAAVPAAPAGAAGRRVAARGSVDARGAAREPVRAGPRHPRQHFDQTNPASAGRGGSRATRVAP